MTADGGMSISSYSYAYTDQEAMSYSYATTGEDMTTHEGLIRVEMTLGALWDLRGRVNPTFNSTEEVFEAIVGEMDLAFVQHHGTDVVKAIVEISETFGVETLKNLTMNTTGFVLPTSFDAPHVPLPTPAPTVAPTLSPTSVPTTSPSMLPTTQPTSAPTPQPSAVPTKDPSPLPSLQPSPVPTAQPTSAPTEQPSAIPSPQPTSLPTPVPTPVPSPAPTPVLRGYRSCVCVTATVAKRLKQWCPDIAPLFDGESCLHNITSSGLEKLVADCPPLQTQFF